jgi:hypothetical protein
VTVSPVCLDLALDPRAFPQGPKSPNTETYLKDCPPALLTIQTHHMHSVTAHDTVVLRPSSQLRCICRILNSDLIQSPHCHIPLVPKFFGQTKKRKRGFCLPMKRSHGSYAAAGTPAVVKEYQAKLVAALKHGDVLLDVFLEANNKAGFTVGQATFFQSVKAVMRGRLLCWLRRSQAHRRAVGHCCWRNFAGKKKRTCSGW